MEKRKFGSTDLRVSPLCYGTWELGGAPFFAPVDEQTARDCIAAAYDSGINFFDTAPVYGLGRAEELLGKELAGKRDKVVLATKCGLNWNGNKVEDISVDNSRNSIRAGLEGSLKRLRTDYVDLLLVHWPENNPLGMPHPESMTPQLETNEALSELQKEGKIRYFGLCNHEGDALEIAVGLKGHAALQNQFSILTQKRQKRALDVCKEYNMGFMAYSPLQNGLLAGKFGSVKERKDVYGMFAGMNPEFDAHVEKAKQLGVVARYENYYSLAYLVLNYTVNHTPADVAIFGSKDPKNIWHNCRGFDIQLPSKVEAGIRRIIG